MPAVTFNLGNSVPGFPNLASIEGWWYVGVPAQPWVRAAMPEPTVSWDQANTLIFWGFSQTNLRGTLLNPAGGIINTSRFPTLRAEAEAFFGQGAVASPQRLLDYYLSD